MLSLTMINTLEEEQEAAADRKGSGRSTKGKARGRNSLRKKNATFHNKNVKTGSAFGSKT